MKKILYLIALLSLFNNPAVFAKGVARIMSSEFGAGQIQSYKDVYDCTLPQEVGGACKCGENSIGVCAQNNTCDCSSASQLGAGERFVAAKSSGIQESASSQEEGKEETKQNEGEAESSVA